MNLKDKLSALATATLTNALAAWEKIKDVVLVLLGLLSLILFGLFKAKSDQAKDLQVQVDNLKTLQEANALQDQINQQLANASNDAQKVQQLQVLLQQLEAKKPNLPSDPNQVSSDLNKEL